MTGEPRSRSSARCVSVAHLVLAGERGQRQGKGDGIDAQVRAHADRHHPGPSGPWRAKTGGVGEEVSGWGGGRWASGVGAGVGEVG